MPWFLPRLLPALLFAVLAGAARAQLYLGDDNRYVEGSAIETFRLDENDPRSLGLFEPLPVPDFTSAFRFDMERFHTVFSPYAAFLKTSEVGQEDEISEIFRRILGVDTTGLDIDAMLVRAERLLENHPNETRNIRGLASLYAMTGKFDRAARNFARYLEKKPSDISFLAGFAHTLFCLARFDDAQSALRRAMELNPRFLPAQYTLTCLNIATNGPILRTRAFWHTTGISEKEQLAGWLQNDRTPLRHVLGTKGYDLLCEMAIGAGSAGNLLLIPDSLAEARAAFARQEWKKALVYYELAEGYGVDGLSVKQQLARCLFETGRGPEALQRMQRLAAQNPDAAEVWYNLGYLLINSKQGAAATLAFREASRLAAAVPEYQFALACALAGDGKMDDAFAILLPLHGKFSARFSMWMEGDSDYLVAIRADPRYAKLGKAAPKK